MHNTLHAVVLQCCMAVCIMLFSLPCAAFAHRVNIVAWTEGKEVVTESSFSNGHKVHHGHVTVMDLRSGVTVLQGETDDRGIFRFTPPDEVLSHGLRLRINAGEGHQNEWAMEPADLPSSAFSPSRMEAAASEPEPQPSSVTTVDANIAAMDVAQLRSIVETSLDNKLGPMRRELAAMRVHRPGVVEIVGGIGWLVGLAGVAAYFKSRKS